MIRPFQVKDTDNLKDIFRKNIPLFFAETELSEFEDYLRKFPETYYVIEHDGKTAGGVGCEYRESDRSGRINWIFLDPEHKGKGLGSEAINYCLNDFRKFKQIEKLVVRTSQYAWKLFEKFGYRLIEIRENFWAEGIDLYLMEMPVKDLAGILTWNNVAEQYREKFNDLTIYDISYDAFLRSLPKGAHLLEAACGPATITSYLVNARPDLNMEAFDRSFEMINVSKSILPTVKFRTGDCRDLHQCNTRYDGIICGFALPYLNQEETHDFISESARLLHRGGLLYLSFIEGQPELSRVQKSSDGKNELFVHYYTSEMIEKIMAEKDLTIRDSFAVNYPGTQDIHRILIAVKS